MKLRNTNEAEGLDPTTLTLHHIATGLVRSFRTAEKQGGAWFPYNRSLETGLNRLLLTAIEHTAPSPSSIPELVSWCHRPLNRWGIEWSEDITGTETLLGHGTPTPFCEQMACLTSDVEADITEQRLMQSVLTLCRDNDAPQSYVAFRKLIIDRPTLSTFEFLEQSGASELILLRDKLQEAYESVPAALFFSDDTVRTCQRCGNALIPLQSGAFRCDEADCDTGRPAKVGRIFPISECPLRLKRGLRVFVAAPGRAEIQLANTLQKRGVVADLWPAFDNYDLRLTFPDQTVWAVDVKDWQNPHHLARKLGQQDTFIPATPPWQSGFFVFPNRRKDEWPDYKRVIQTRCHLPQSISVCFESEFLRQVSRKQKG